MEQKHPIDLGNGFYIAHSADDIKSLAYSMFARNMNKSTFTDVELYSRFKERTIYMYRTPQIYPMLVCIEFHNNNSIYVRGTSVPSRFHIHKVESGEKIRPRDIKISYDVAACAVIYEITEALSTYTTWSFLYPTSYEVAIRALKNKYEESLLRKLDVEGLEKLLFLEGYKGIAIIKNKDITPFLLECVEVDPEIDQHIKDFATFHQRFSYVVEKASVNYDTYIQKKNRGYEFRAKSIDHIFTPNTIPDTHPDLIRFMDYVGSEPLNIQPLESDNDTTIGVNVHTT